jgi:hypothetical protein
MQSTVIGRPAVCGEERKFTKKDKSGDEYLATATEGRGGLYTPRRLSQRIRKNVEWHACRYCNP